MATNDERNIVITGFMATGKSTVAPFVAAYLGREFIEMDDEIVRRVGKTIPQIFAEDGEAAFRQFETELCRDLAKRTGLVISTGGGALINETNRQLMLDSSFVVCLILANDELEDRLSGDGSRPLSDTWRDVLANRRPIYASIPNQVDTTYKTPEQIMEEIITLWENDSA